MSPCRIDLIFINVNTTHRKFLPKKTKKLCWTRKSSKKSAPTMIEYFSFLLQTMLTRMNKITKVEYLRDPVKFGWELINEIGGSCNHDTPIHKTLTGWNQSDYSIWTPEGHAFRLCFSFNGQLMHLPLYLIATYWIEVLYPSSLGHHWHMPTCLDAKSSKQTCIS